MHYKKIQNNKFLIGLDWILRKFGLCLCMNIDIETGKILDTYIKSSHTSHKP